MTGNHRKFKDVNDLRKMLEDAAREAGIEDGPPIRGYVNFTYKIGPLRNGGSLPIAIGEFPEETLNDFMSHLFDSIKAGCMMLRNSPCFTEGDEELLKLFEDVVANYSQKDVELIDWDFIPAKD